MLFEDEFPELAAFIQECYKTPKYMHPNLRNKFYFPPRIKNDRFIPYTLEELASFMYNKTHSSNVGRNDLCPCGSKKKYKKCCLY